MTNGDGLFKIFVLSFLTCCCYGQTFSRNQVPLQRGDYHNNPNFVENDIRTGFVKYLLYSAYNTTAAHPCDRMCSFNKPFICYYQLFIEESESYNEQACRPECLNNPTYNTCYGCIQTDGVKTRLLSINGRMPGPPLNVCRGDLIIVDVVNVMTQEGTSMHWHGIDQSLTPYMDGMPFITQAEIPPGQIYRYKFIASNHGTNFYHSHSYFQRGQGVYGTLLVRLPPKTNPHWYQYDLDLTEHSIVISDWGYNLERRADNFLIHGKGWSVFQDGYRGAPVVYFVRRYYRYRFRIIYNGVNNIPIEFSIDNHDLVLIAADGTEIEPVPVSSIILNTGERFDFVLIPNQPVDNYWMKVCNPLNRTLSQVAIVHYVGATTGYPARAPDFSQRPPGLQVNSLSVGPGTPGSISVSELRSLNRNPLPPQDRWKTTYLEIGVNLTVLNFEIDKISMIMPQTPLLIEKDRIDDQVFCNRNTLQHQGINCTQTTCRCMHVIQYELNTYIEIIFYAGSLHPVHLHGYLFYVVGMGVTSRPMTRELIIEMDRSGQLARNKFSPILKDTVQVPAGGWVIIQFFAFNAGYWFLHCHIERHALRGMSAVLQIGQPKQMIPQPKGFEPYPI